MSEQRDIWNLSHGQLLKIIRIQTWVAQQGLDLSSIMFLVARESQDLTNADGAVIELAERDEMVYRVATGIAEEQLGLRLPISQSLSGLCITTGETLICDDSEEDERVDKIGCRKVGLRSMIVNPLRYGTKNVGVLKVMSKKVYAFGEIEIQIIKLLSDLIAASIYTAAEYEENELYRKATTDYLTGLSNRALFFDRLRVRIMQSKRTGETFGVILYDMDDLKRINDELGHRAGDAALKEIASRARKTLREYDTLARLGGDEFAVIVHSITTAHELEHLCERLISAIVGDYSFEGNAMQLRASLGYSLYPEDGIDIHELVEKADQRMYAVKRKKDG